MWDHEATIVDDADEFVSPVDPRTKHVSAAWWYNGEYKFKRADEFHQTELLEDIEKADFIVGHGAKYDLQWLARCGVDLTKLIIYDTAIGEYVLAGNRKWKLDLHSVCLRYGLPGKKLVYQRLMKLCKVCPSLWPEKWLKEYNLEDVVGALGVFTAQRVELQRLGLLPTMYTRCLVTPMLADIERHGMQVDKDRVTRIYRKLTDEYNTVMVEMNALTGGINPRSSKQVAEFLYDKLKFPVPRGKAKKQTIGKDGQLKGNLGPTDTKSIAALLATTPEQERFLQIKKRQSYLEAKIGKSFQKFLDCINDVESNGLVQFRFNQTVTANHRLSSSGARHKIQGQNLDREVKPVFKCKNEGWKLGEWDYSGIEWRTAAFLSHDPVAIQGIVNKEDIHSYTASHKFRDQLIELHGGKMPTLEEIKKLYEWWRQEAKPTTFSPVYGAEVGDGTPGEIAYFEAFKKKYHVLYDTQMGWCVEAMNTKQHKTITGLIFYWPNAKLETYNKRVGQRWEKATRIVDKRGIFNYPVSSLATADISQIGAVCSWHRIKALGLRSFLVSVVHDAEIAEVHPDEIEVMNTTCRQGMLDDMLVYLKRCYNIDFDVPLEVEENIGDFWKDKPQWREKWLQ